MRFVYTFCGRESLLPKSMKISARYNRSESAQPGEFPDVRRGSCDGKDVVVKVFEVLLSSDVERIRKVGGP